MSAGRWFRWKALLPLSLMLIVLGLVWYFLLDVIVARSVESFGATLVGAQVDVEGADVRLTEGFLILRGLQVTNPDRPMMNLFEAEEIVADLRIGPLLGKKIFIDTLAVRNLRFNTEREESGEIAEPSETSQAIRRQIGRWAEQVTVPPFSLGGLGAALNVDAISPDSLRTPAALIALGQTLSDRRQTFSNVIAAADPTGTVTSGRQLLDSLQGKSLRDLGLQGSARAVRQMRDLLSRLDEHRNALASVDDSIATLSIETSEIERSLGVARAQDLVYARGLLQLPSINTPDLTPSLLGEFAVERVRSVLYWITAAERFIPPGLNPRRRSGPRRARRSGSTVEFPSAESYPAFTLAFAEVEVTLDSGAGAGTYSAVLNNVTSSPAALGAPMTLEARRTGQTGRSTVGISALFDHTGYAVHDSANVRLAGVSLPAIALPGLSTTLNLDHGATEFGFVRSGDSVEGRMSWSSSSVSWASVSAGSPIVSELQRVIEGVESVEIELAFTGHISSPRLSIRSNLGRVMADAVKSRLQAEVSRAEDSIRAEIDRHVRAPLEAYQTSIDNVRNELSSRVSEERARINQMRAELEARIRNLASLPIG